MPENRRYSLAFENAATECVTRKPSNGLFEVYAKLGYAHSFLAFCERYRDLSGKRFIEVGCGIG